MASPDDLDALLRALRNDALGLDAQELLYFANQNPDLPTVDDLAALRREEVRAEIHDAEEEGVLLRRLVTPPDDGLDRVARTLDAAARLACVRELLDAEEAILVLVDVDDGFDVSIVAPPECPDCIDLDDDDDEPDAPHDAKARRE